MLPFHRTTRTSGLTQMVFRLSLATVGVILTVRALRWMMRSVRL